MHYTYSLVNMIGIIKVYNNLYLLLIIINLLLILLILRLVFGQYYSSTAIILWKYTNNPILNSLHEDKKYTRNLIKKAD